MPFDTLTIREPARDVEVVRRTDVLVVGSGPGGLAAALAAARAGAQVTLLERFGCFGGNLTAVGVEGLAWYRHEQTVEAGGIGREFEDRAVAMGAAVPDSQSLSHEIDAEAFKLIADRLVQEAAIHPMLHRLFVGTVMDGDTIRGVIVESKAGREAILARRVIDATGDADVAHRAGAPTLKTPREQMQAASVLFHLAGVDKEAFLEGVRADPQTYADWTAGEWTVQTSGKEDELFSPFLRKPFAQAIRDGVIPAELTTIAGTWGAIHDTGELTYMNLVHLAGCDGTDPDSLIRGEIEGRRLSSLLSLIDDFDREIISTSHEIDQQAKVDERVTLLCQIRGVRRYTAMLIIAEIGDIRRFPTARHLCAWAGLTPTVRSSDTKTRLGRITKQGSHLLRWALVEAAQKTPTGGGPLREQYERIAKRRGAKVARVAIARQILTLSYYGLRDGEIRRLKPPAPASPMKVSATA